MLQLILERIFSKEWYLFLPEDSMAAKPEQLARLFERDCEACWQRTLFYSRGLRVGVTRVVGVANLTFV